MYCYVHFLGLLSILKRLLHNGSLINQWGDTVVYVHVVVVKRYLDTVSITVSTVSVTQCYVLFRERSVA